jgi:hypothetical protein
LRNDQPSVVWSSDRDGQLGTGERFTKRADLEVELADGQRFTAQFTFR